MLDISLYMGQRLSALVMIPLVLGHIAVMAVAIDGGLTTAEILSRTQGSVFWTAFYGLFVVAVSIHAAIGVSVIAHEWLALRGMARNALGWTVFAVMLTMGGRAVLAVTWP